MFLTFPSCFQHKKHCFSRLCVGKQCIKTRTNINNRLRFVRARVFHNVSWFAHTGKHDKALIGNSISATMRLKLTCLHVQYIFCDFKQSTYRQRVDTIKREMFSQKSVRRFVGDSSAFVMGAMFLASALNRGISPRY